MSTLFQMVIGEEISPDFSHERRDFKLQSCVQAWRHRSKHYIESNRRFCDEMMMASIRVCCRQRRLHQTEMDSIGFSIIGKAATSITHEHECLTLQNNCVHVHCENINCAGSRTITTKDFPVHTAFGPEIDDISGNIGMQLATTACSGGSANCIAFGSTGSGKTYTQMQVLDSTSKKIFRHCQETGKQLKLSFCEIWREKCFDIVPCDDILSGKSHVTDAPKRIVSIREDSVGRIHTDSKKIEIVSELDLERILNICWSTRRSSSTQVNDISSRSHAICTLFIEHGGQLRVVDLAGSERYEDAIGHSQALIKESIPHYVV